MTDQDPPVPLAEEPIGAVVARVEADDPEVAALVASPKRQLAFRAFACVRVGLLLGELLVDHDVESKGARTWAEELLADPGHYERAAEVVRAVAREVGADPELAEPEPGADEKARERFRRFARESLGE